MTRKTALQKAIEIIQRSDIDREEAQEIVEALELCRSELPFAKWTEAAIFDACDQYCQETGRPYLISSDFQKAGLPSHTTIKNRFGMTAGEFRDTFYPINKNPMNRKGKRLRYTAKTDEEYLREFAERYREIKPVSAEMYNRMKPDDAPGTQTLQRMAGVSGWGKLLEKYGLNQRGERERKVSYTGSKALRYLKEIAKGRGISEE